jgi:hypothetical protein
MATDTESFGMRVRIFAISAKSLAVAWSDSGGILYVPSRTALEAGVFARYPKSWNKSLLHIGASPARVYRLLCTLLKILCSTVS